MRVRLLAPLALAALSTTGAQQVRGIVRDAATTAPLAGAVVTLIDSAGNRTGRTIADRDGRFALAPGSRDARLHLIRIGYQPRDAELPARRDTLLQLAMVRLPAILSAVRVTDRELCPGSSDRGPAFQLWEDARAGLLAAVVAREAKPAEATTLMFDRDLSRVDDRVRRQHVTTQTGQTRRPFLAAFNAATFVERGYMQEDAAGRTYSAPDADVLLDESFAATHCFHRQSSDSGHADQVGLAFTPVPGRDSLVEVSVVIWLDRNAPALRSLDFRFVGLEPAAASVGTGGHLEFRTVANGVSFIEWWVIRLPSLTLVRATAATPIPVRRQDRVAARVAEIHENGGQVAAVTWNDGTAWHQRPTAIVGTAVQRDRGIPAANAVATLVGTGDTTLTGADGQFTFARVVPGKYNLTVIDTTLHAFASDRVETRPVDVVRGEISNVRLALAPLVDVIADLCRGQKVRDGTSTLIGRVALPLDSSVRGARVRASWQGNFNGGTPVHVDDGASRSVTIDNAAQDIDVDDAGHFVVCGVARGRPIQLRFVRGGATADTVVFVRDSLIKPVEWMPRPHGMLERKAAPPN